MPGHCHYPAKKYVRQMKIREGDGDRTATIGRGVGRGVMKTFARTILCACYQLGLHPLLVVSCVEPFNKYVWKRATMPESSQCIAQDGNRMDEHIIHGALASGRSSFQQFSNYKRCSPMLTSALFCCGSTAHPRILLALFDFRSEKGTIIHAIGPICPTKRGTKCIYSASPRFACALTYSAARALTRSWLFRSPALFSY